MLCTFNVWTVSDDVLCSNLIVPDSLLETTLVEYCQIPQSSVQGSAGQKTTRPEGVMKDVDVNQGESAYSVGEIFVIWHGCTTNTHYISLIVK